MSRLAVLLALASLALCYGNETCGRNQPEGYQTCGLNTCCSIGGAYCGTTELYCGEGHCNSDYGHCGIIASPSCSATSGSSGQRTIGYYQSWAPEKVCPVGVNEIDTTGLTHLNWAFLRINPNKCSVVVPKEHRALYPKFIAYQSNGVQTWVSIGGGGTEETSPIISAAFSTIASTQKCRRQFANSLLNFLRTYNFQGVDLDWESPSSADDTRNLVLLTKTIHNVFATASPAPSIPYGLSVYLQPFSGALLAYDVPGMAPYVDFFNFGAYDLFMANDDHNPPFIRAHTDVRTIDSLLEPLWFAGVDPASINLGLAYYGYSYQLTDTTCAHPGKPCKYKGPGLQGNCTADPESLTTHEIEGIIADQDLTPVLYKKPMAKGVVYNGDNVVFYDDAETFAMKRRYANGRCLGGTAIWSMDIWNVGKQ